MSTVKKSSSKVEKKIVGRREETIRYITGPAGVICYRGPTGAICDYVTGSTGDTRAICDYVTGSTDDTGAICDYVTGSTGDTGAIYDYVTGSTGDTGAICYTGPTSATASTYNGIMGLTHLAAMINSYLYDVDPVGNTGVIDITGATSDSSCKRKFENNDPGDISKKMCISHNSIADLENSRKRKTDDTFDIDLRSIKK